MVHKQVEIWGQNPKNVPARVPLHISDDVCVAVGVQSVNSILVPYMDSVLS
jgi:hypothetical protein